MDIRLLEQPFDAAAAHGDFINAHGALGAVASFTGLVRPAAGRASGASPSRTGRRCIASSSAST